MGCWIWTGRTNDHGIPVIRTRVTTTTVARYYWKKANGEPPPEGKELYPLCGNSVCVNPDHREPLTRRESAYRSGKTMMTPQRVYRVKRDAARGTPPRKMAYMLGVSERTVRRTLAGYYDHLGATSPNYDARAQERPERLGRGSKG